MLEAVDNVNGWDDLADAATSDGADESPVGVVLWLEGV
jgi:hypothetical protein